MKKYSVAFALALLSFLPGSASAAVVTVSGHGQSYDPGIAMQDARADAVAQCTAQGGTPLQEIYSHIHAAFLRGKKNGL